MAGIADDFDRFADLFNDALLLVTSRGRICAANRAARGQLLGAMAAAQQTLSSFVEDSEDKVLEYLRLCSRSSQKLPGTLTFGREGGSRVYHCEGTTFRMRGANGAPLVMLRIVPKEDSIGRFVALNQRIEQLKDEVSRRLYAERSAAEQWELLRVTLGSIGDAVITTDTDGRVTFMNPVAARLTGWEQEEVLGEPLDHVFAIRNEDTGAEVESPVRKVLRLGLTVGLANHTVLIRKDGARLPIDDSGAPIKDSAGRLLGVVLVFHEISERRKMERELKRQADALREADRRKDEFLAMLAHELRNPLAPLHNAIQILHAQGQQADVARLAHMMERQMAQLTKLVDDLLDIARITRGTIRLDKRPVTLARVIEHAIETARPLIDERAHRLYVDAPPETLSVNADFTRLSQAFCNVLNNAAKFMEPGGEITVTAVAEDGRAVVRVRDKGRGMDREFLSRVFELFTQEDRSLDRSEGGLGIGLRLVKALMHMHGGEARAFSEGSGRGSELVLWMPAMEQAEPASLPAQPQLRDRLGARVLIVDDNADAADSLDMLLSSWGCDTHIAEDGETALRAAESLQPDVVLLDIGLPRMDGFEVARRLRQSFGMGTMRIIAVTGYGGEVDRHRSKEAGFDEHLTKPVNLAALRELLARQP